MSNRKFSSVPEWEVEDLAQRIQKWLGREPQREIVGVLADEYSREGVPWQDDDDDEWLKDAYLSHEKAFKLGRKSSASPTLRRTSRPKPAASPSHTYRLRARLLAQTFKQDPWVLYFRMRFLPDGLLRLDQVADWIEARAKEEEGLPDIFYEAVKLPDGTLSPTGRSTRKFLEWATPGDEMVRTTPVAHGGVLEKLLEASESLSRDWGWPQWAAVLFVLTDTVFVPAPVTISFYFVGNDWGYGRFILEVDPETGPTELMQAYRNERQRVYTSKRRKPLGERALCLVEFVLDNPDLSWPQRLEKWNKEHPEWRYERWETMLKRFSESKKRLAPPWNYEGIEEWFSGSPKEDSA